MWIIAKYKLSEFSLLKKNFSEVLGESPRFYIPKIKYQKLVKNKIRTFEKPILEGYLICFHKKFADYKILLKLKYAKGLSYILDGFKENQKEISFFVNHCKNFEDDNGYLSQGFFDKSDFTKGKFISGPFTDLVFDIISRQGNKLKVLIGNLKTSINKESGNFYRPV